MKQLVVAAVVLVAFFSFGPWFAGKVGPSLSDAITEWATQPEPCPTATTKPPRKAHPPRPHADRPNKRAEPRRKAERQQRPRAPKPSSTCSPSPTSSPRTGGPDRE